MIFPDITYTAWLFTIQPPYTNPNVGFMSAAEFMSLTKDEVPSQVHEQFINTKPHLDPDAKETKGFYYSYRHSKMFLLSSDDIKNYLQPNRFYCLKKSIDKLTLFLNAELYPNQTEYGKTVEHLQTYYIDAFREGENFFQLGTEYPYPPSLGENT